MIHTVDLAHLALIGHDAIKSRVSLPLLPDLQNNVILSYRNGIIYFKKRLILDLPSE
ncbi:MAG: hypothetical protein OXM61_24830 [Candidatus Poribacteria bacterium]|nr:hypothetical protein [Candidatus Poribacteria bacterium]